MKLAVPTETRPGETRVAMVPDVAGRLVTSGVEVVVQSGAGADAHFPDAMYSDKGASLASSAADVMAGRRRRGQGQRPHPRRSRPPS